MRPFKTLLFGLTVLTMMLMISLFSDHGKTVIGKWVIRLPDFRFSTTDSSHQYKDISGIVRIGNLLNDTVALGVSPDSLKISHDSISFSSHKVAYSGINADSLKILLHPFEFPAKDDTILYPFFRELSQLAHRKTLIRILHYGDSQIEGDRITSYIRNQLQTRFGGEGIGLFPLVAVNPSSVSYVYSISDNWQRFSAQFKKTDGENSNKYGILLNYARLEPSGGLFKKQKPMEGWVRLDRSNIAYRLAQKFKQCRIFYGFNHSSMMVELMHDEDVVDAEIVPLSNRLKVLQWKFDSPLKNLTIHFKTDESPDVFGISLDGFQGIAVDNIPLRGSAGLEFTKSDLKFLSHFYSLLNVKLIVLQFGVNVVPNIRTNYSYYEEGFYRQLLALKASSHGQPVIVMGVSDVSRNTASGFESYPNIEKIRNAQKNAAFKAGCAFWDVYEAMGGKNSMPSWVYASPPLAQKDFIHFNPRGARIIGEMFYSSLMHEYDRYLEVKAKSNDQPD